MNILFVSTAYPPSIGGAQRHLHALAKNLIRKGHKVRIAVLTQQYRRDYLGMTTIAAERPGSTVYDGLEVQRMGLSPWERSLQLPTYLSYYPSGASTGSLGLAPWVTQLRHLASGADVIHGVRIGREFIYQAAFQVAGELGIPFVLTPCHHPRWKGRLYRQWDLLYREAQAVIALTEAEADLLAVEKGVAKDRIHVTGIGPLLEPNPGPNGVAAFRESRGISGPYVLFLGQQLPYKGVDHVLLARRVLRDRYPDLSFVFAGPQTSYSRRLFRRVSDARVHQLGALSQAEKTAALLGAELLCVPSSQESFGGVYVEAWACGRPVIGLRTAQVASVVSHGEDGLLAENGREVPNLISALLEDPARAEQMGRSGKEKVDRLYSWSALTDATLQVYRSLTGAEKK